MRVVIPQIISIRSIQSPIPLAPITLLILRPDTKQQDNASSRTHPQQPQTRCITSRVMRRFLGDEDVARHNAPAIAEPDHHGTSDRTFVMASHVVLNPSQSHGLTGVATADDDEDGKVANAHRH